MLIEFARNVCNIKNADSEETGSGQDNFVVSKLSCSLVGEQEELKIIDKDSILYRIIKQINLVGRYYCNYGFNEKYRKEFESRGCIITAVSKEGNVRGFEIKGHPFFIGTLFQPALTSTGEKPDPVIVEFVNRCVKN